MDRRFVLALVLSFLVLLVFQIWIAPKNARRTPVRGADTTSAVQAPIETSARHQAEDFLAAPPAAPDTTAAGIPAFITPAADTVPAVLIPIRTGTVEASFTTEGGRLLSWVLNDFRTHDGDPVEIARAGELGLVLETDAGVVDLRDVPFRHRTETVQGGQAVIFEADFPSGLRVTKRYTIPAEGYLMDLTVEIAGDERVTQYRLAWDHALPFAEGDTKLEHQASGAVALLGKDVETLRPGSFKKQSEKELAGTVRWAGVRNKYFLAAMVPPEETSTRLVATGDADLQTAGIQVAMPLLRGEGRHDFHVYMGPLDYDRLKKIGHELDKAVNLGWKPIRPLSQLLLFSMEWTYKFVPNFGLVIIIISALTKLIFYPLTRTSVRSMRAMQVLQPEMNALREKYKGDPQRLQKEMMELYKKNKVNPMGGCIPILLQMPVFIALYAVLANAIELRQAPFVGWISDLSIPDVLTRVGGFPIHVLPVVMFITTLLQQMLTPVTDPRQKIMGYLMPVMMLFIFYSFPAGLNLYWTVNNVLTVAQQWQIHREVAREQAAKA